VIEVSELPCGLRLATEAMAEARSVAVGFWVGTGSRDEEAALAGACHFLEHMLFKGTPRRSARQVAEAIDAVGGDMNAFTAKEHTAFYVRVLAGDLEVGLDVLCDVVWSPALRPEDLEAERKVILEELAMRADEPAELVHDLFNAAHFAGHPLGRDPAGTAQSVSRLSRQELSGFFSHHYNPANMVVAAAGALSHDSLAQALEARFAGPGHRAVPSRVPPAPPEARSAVLTRPTEQAHLVLGLRGPGHQDEDRWAASVLNYVLGGGVSSRLFQEVREKRGLAYSIFSERAGYEDSGTLSVYVGTSPERAHEVAGLVGRQLEELAGGVRPSELELAAGHLSSELLLSEEDAGSRMGRAGRELLCHNRVMAAEEVVERIRSVSGRDVERVAARLLAGPPTLAVVGPFAPEEWGASSAEELLEGAGPAMA
jgi:predicted Zn-dependent peptidase